MLEKYWQKYFTGDNVIISVQKHTGMNGCRREDILNMIEFMGGLLNEIEKQYFKDRYSVKLRC